MIFKGQQCFNRQGQKANILLNIPVFFAIMKLCRCRNWKCGSCFAYLFMIMFFSRKIKRLKCTSYTNSNNQERTYFFNYLFFIKRYFEWKVLSYFKPSKSDKNIAFSYLRICIFDMNIKKRSNEISYPNKMWLNTSFFFRCANKD